MECDTESCPFVSLSIKLTKVLLGKTYKERDNNTEAELDSELEADAKQPYKDTILRALEESNLDDTLFWKLRARMYEKAQIRKGEKLLEAVRRSALPDSFYKEIMEASK